MPTCPHCQMINAKGTRICYNCGYRIHPFAGVHRDAPAEYWEDSEEEWEDTENEEGPN